MKHEQKGEQMKIIELSDSTIDGMIDFISSYSIVEKFKHIKDECLSVLKNAKPIPTEPRWSEEDIKAEANILLKKCSFNDEEFRVLSRYLKLIFVSLKTPKPKMREMDIKEKEAWIVKLVFDYTDNSNGDKIKIKFKGECFEYGLLGFLQDDSDCTYYRVSDESPWLPIPQIEIESEK